MVRLMALLSVLAALAWALGRHDPVDPAWRVAGRWLLVALSAGPALLAWRSAARTDAVLAWDGTGWTLQLPGDATGADARGVALRLIIDLGGWLLVRCQEPRRGWLRRARTWWLPMQCGTDRARWHALRCALYASAAEPAAAGSAAS